MRYGLACGLAIVNPNVERVWLELLLEQLTNVANFSPQVGEFISLQVKNAFHVAAGDDQSVTGTNWISVVKRQHGRVLKPDSLGRWRAKWTIGAHDSG